MCNPLSVCAWPAIPERLRLNGLPNPISYRHARNGWHQTQESRPLSRSSRPPRAYSNHYEFASSRQLGDQGQLVFPGARFATTGASQGRALSGPSKRRRKHIIPLGRASGPGLWGNPNDQDERAIAPEGETHLKATQSDKKHWIHATVDNHFLRQSHLGSHNIVAAKL